MPAILPTSKQTAASRGVTLIEVAVGLVIMSVLGVAFSSLMATGIDTQMSHRMQTMEQSIAMNIVDDLRMDLRFANNVSFLNGGNSLRFNTFNESLGGDIQIEYIFTGTTLTRQIVGPTQGPVRNYLANTTLPLQVLCNSPCFQAIVNNGTTVRGMTLNNLRVADASQTNDLIARHFGVRSQFRVMDTSFDIFTGSQFR